MYPYPFAFPVTIVGFETTNYVVDEDDPGLQMVCAEISNGVSIIPPITVDLQLSSSACSLAQRKYNYFNTLPPSNLSPLPTVKFEVVIQYTMYVFRLSIAFN